MSTTSHRAGALRALVQSAVLAPSSHNTQPWVFRLERERLELYGDRTRALPVNDPHDRELTVSCAAAWFNVRVAAAHAGMALQVSVLPDGAAGDRLFAATPGPGAPEPDLPPFSAIASRRTHRQAFAALPVPDDVVDALRAAAGAEGAHLTVLDEAARTTLVSLVAEGDRRQFADLRWRRELAAWMRPRRKGDGLVVSELAAPATRFIVSHFDVGRTTAGKDARLAEGSPVLAVVSTDGDGTTDWLAAGQALQRLLLTACHAGLQASYLNQPLQVQALRPRVTQLLDPGRTPQLVLRLGYPTEELAGAPRRPLGAVLREEVGDTGLEPVTSALSRRRSPS